MKLTPSQIKHIHDFVKRKYVDYYDVQIELVDHIATSIEEKIEVNPKLDFYTALQQVYEGFGRFGFMKFVEEKEKQVQRRFRKMHTRELLKFFTIPRILFSLGLVVVLNEFYSVVSYETGLITTGGVLMSMVITLFVLNMRRQKKASKPLLFYQGNFTFLLIYNTLIQGLSSFAFEHLYNQSTWVLALIATALFVGNISIFTTDKIIRAEQRRLYPEAFAI